MHPSIAILLVAGFFVALQDSPPPDRIAELIRLLADDELSLRESATRELERLGIPALEALRKAAKATADPEVGSRLMLAVKAIECRAGIAARKVSIEIAWPDPPPTRWEVNTRKSVFKIRIRNANDYDVLVRRRFDVAVHDAGGNEVPRSAGLWPGCIESGCGLRFEWMNDFVTVGAGASADIQDNIACFRHDPRGGHLGWTFDAPGIYTLAVRSAFDRAAFKACCRSKCADHEDPAAPWNLALEWSSSVRAPISIVQPPPVACPAHLREFGLPAVEHAAQGHLEKTWCATCPQVPRNFGCGDAKHPWPVPTATCCYWCAGERGLCAICGVKVGASK